MSESKDRTEQEAAASDDASEKPHGMPLTLGSGGYGGEECTGPKAKREGHCPDGQSERKELDSERPSAVE